MPGIIQLHEVDNVGVCGQSIAAGEMVMIADSQIKIAVSLGIGHKLAIKPIAAGEPIIKYGVSIGMATVSIKTGEHVHTHNMKSNYIPTYSIPPAK